MNSYQSNQTNTAVLFRSFAKPVVLLILVGLCSTGCKNPSNTIGAGAAGGAAIGGAIGSMGGRYGLLIGAGAGALVGATVGIFIQKNQMALELKTKMSKAKIEESQKVLNDLLAYNKYLDTQITKIKETTAKLKELENTKKITAAQKLQQSKEVVKQIDTMVKEVDSTAAALSKYRSELEAQTQANQQLDAQYRELIRNLAEQGAVLDQKKQTWSELRAAAQE